jgi:hypothetical protein
MTNPTSNYGWQMPTATDLVTDLPADFEVFGQAVDTAMADLLGGTAGQILAKNTNANMDFVWITNDVGDITAVTAGTGISGGGTSGAVTITNDMATTITASGDIVIGTGSGTYDNLPIGTTGQILTADTTVSPYKVKWASPAGGGKVLQVVAATTDTLASNSTTTYADTGLTATITPTSATSKILVLVNQNGCSKSSANSGNALGIQVFRGATSIGLSQNVGQTATTLRFNGLSVGFSILDAPATTSATTYKTQFKNDTAAAQVRVQEFSDLSCIVLLEIGA